jgi:pimeloyl-ACP methyl ester carboxylesterase
VAARELGLSGLPRPPGFKGRNITDEDMSVERIALDLIEVARTEGVTNAVFVGHSMGVQTILEVYGQAPELVAGLVAIAGPYENPLNTFFGRGFWNHLFPVGRVAVTAMPSFLTRAWWKVGNNAAFGLRAARAIGAAGPKVTTELLAPYITHLSTRDPVILFKAIDGMRRHSAADLLPNVKVPVLNLVARRDNFTPPAVQEHMHDVLPDSELVVFEDATHCLPIEEPEAIAEAMDRFLDRLQVSAGRTGPGS